jgi:hypothetical protein
VSEKPEVSGPESILAISNSPCRRDDLTDPVFGWEARYGIDLDGQDFLDWQVNYGNVAPVAASTSQVPEPYCC